MYAPLWPIILYVQMEGQYLNEGFTNFQNSGSHMKHSGRQSGDMQQIQS